MMGKNRNADLRPMRGSGVALDARAQRYRDAQRAKAGRPFKRIFPKAEGKEPRVPEVVPFRGLPRLEDLGAGEYCLAAYAKRVTGMVPFEESGVKSGDAVAAVLVGMFVSKDGNGVHSPGAGYAPALRHYTSEQTRVYLGAMKVLEVLFETDAKGMAGFADREAFRVISIKGLLARMAALEGGAKYDLVRLQEPGRMFGSASMAIAAGELMEAKLGAAEGVLESTGLLGGTAGKNMPPLDELRPVTEELDRLGFFRDETGFEEMRAMLAKYLEEHGKLPPKVREFLSATLRSLDRTLGAAEEAQAEVEGIATGTKLEERLCAMLGPNGVLIREAGGDVKLPGMRLVGTYNGVGLYQRA